MRYDHQPSSFNSLLALDNVKRAINAWYKGFGEKVNETQWSEIEKILREASNVQRMMDDLLGSVTLQNLHRSIVKDLRR